MAFIDCTEQQIPRPIDKRRRDVYYSRQEEKTYTVKMQLMVNNQWLYHS